MSKVVGKIKAVLGLDNSKFDQGLDQSKKKTNKFSDTINKLGKSMAGLFAAGAVIGMFKKWATENANLEKGLKSLQAITGVNNDELKFFGDQAKKTSLKTLQSADDIVKAYELVGSARPELLANSRALADVTEQAVILSEATGGQLGLEGSVEAVTASLNQFNLSNEDAERVINTLAAGSKFGSVMVADLAASFKNVGAVASTANVSFEQTTALLEVLGEKQIKGAEAGTKLRGTIIKLQDANLGYESGQFNINDALKEAVQLLDTLGTEAERDAAMINLFGLENITAGKILLSNIDVYEELTEKVTGTTTALEQQKIQNSTLSAEWKKLGNTIKTITTSEKSTTFLKGIVKFTRQGIYELANMGNMFKKLGKNIALMSKAIFTKMTWEEASIEYGKFVDELENETEEALQIIEINYKKSGKKSAKDYLAGFNPALHQGNPLLQEQNQLLEEARKKRDNAITSEQLAKANRQIQLIELEIEKLNELGKVEPADLKPQELKTVGSEDVSIGLGITDEELERLGLLNFKAEELNNHILGLQTGTGTLGETWDLVFTNNQFLIDSMVGSVDSLMSAFEDLFGGSSKGFKDLAANAVKAIGKIIIAEKARAIAGMIADGAKKGLPGLILATVGIAAVTGLFASKIPKLAGGGVIPGGYPNDSYPAMLSSGEVVTPPGALPGGGMGSGELVARVSGRDLEFVLKKYETHKNSIT